MGLEDGVSLMLKAEIMGGWWNLYEQFQTCSPNIWGCYFAFYEQNNPRKWSLRTRCGGPNCRRSVQALAHMLCHVPSISCCSQFCLILQPHRVVQYTFSSKFCVATAEQLCSNPWRNDFVEGKIGDHPSKIAQKWPKLGGGVIDNHK